MHQRDRRQQLDSAATSNDAVRLQERRVAEVLEKILEDGCLFSSEFIV